MLGLDALDVQTVHEPVDGTLSYLPSADGKRVDLRYVVADPFPPKAYWPEDGSKGFLATEPDERGVPLALTSATVRQVDSPEGATHWYVPPEGLSTQDWRRYLRGFEAWRNGEVYGIARETYAVHAVEGRLSQIDIAVDWGCLDLDTAIELAGVDESHAPAPR